MRNNRDRSIAFLMLLPSLILLAIFVYYFIGRAIQTSTTDWGENPAQPALSQTVEVNYVGLDNYVRLMTSFTESSFRVSLVNTFFFTIFFVAGCIVVGMFLAILLDQKVAGEGIFRTVFLFPMALSFVVTGTIWRWMLQPRGGINILPTLIGLAMVGWVAATKLFDVELPELPIPEGLLLLGLGAFAALLIILRLLMGYEVGNAVFSVSLDRKFGLFLATLAGIGLAGGGFLKFQEGGGQMPGKSSGGSTGDGGNATPF